MSDIINCFAVIHMPNISAISADACAGARATIRAAEIQAKATRSAGTETLLSGIFALVAALVTAVLAYSIAKSESKRIKREQEIKRKAYATALHALLYNVCGEIDIISKNLNELSRAASSKIKIPNFLDIRFHRAANDALSLQRWNDISVLPENIIKYAVESSIAVDANIQIHSKMEYIFNNVQSLEMTSGGIIAIYNVSNYRSTLAENKKILDRLMKKLCIIIK